MKVTIEVSSQNDLEKILLFFQTLKLENILVINGATKIKDSNKGNKKPRLTKGNKSINPEDLFGIWKETPRTLEQIRETAWRRP